jgi:ribose transport system ATP-binding protein
MFACTELAKSYGTTQALDRVSLRLEPGQCHGLLGENGAGKSTLIRLIGGADVQDGGTMTFLGRDYAPRDPSHARQLGVAVVHQELCSLLDLSVLDNLFLGSQLHRAGWLALQRMEERARPVLAAVGLEHLDLHTPLEEVSLAHRQLLEIAKARLFAAKLVVLDEPTSSLGAAQVDHVLELIKNLCREGCAVLFVSHALEEVARATQRWTVLRSGKVAGSGVTGANDRQQWLDLMSGSAASLHESSNPQGNHGGAMPRDATTLMRVQGLCSAGKRTVRASFELHAGEVLGIAGLVGSGRSTLLRCLAGLQSSMAGEVHIGRQKLEAEKLFGHNSWQQGIGYVSEDRRREGIALQASLLDNLTLPTLSQYSRFGWLDTRKLTRAALATLTARGVRFSNIEQSIVELSGGNQQKIAIARLEFSRASILLLDEPTRGIDHAARLAIYAWILDFVHSGDRSQERAAIVVSSYLPELFALADRLAVMCDGELGEARPIAQWNTRSVLAAAHAGVDEACDGGPQFTHAPTGHR